MKVMMVVGDEALDSGAAIDKPGLVTMSRTVILSHAPYSQQPPYSSCLSPPYTWLERLSSLETQ
jgi:hypothetical protein